MVHSLGSLESSEQLIRDLYIDLRRKINSWAMLTKQTAQARMGYVGQHLVSVVTGYPGGRSGARGKDIVLPDDKFAEIKTCYKVDQLGKCGDCGAPVSSIELKCPSCESENIIRKDDSKWLIGIQHEEEFAEVLSPESYFLVLFEFTDLERPDTIRASIWSVNPLVPGFAYCIIDYHKNIQAKSKSGAPFNFWPYSLKFDLMRPDLIYRSLILPNDTIETQIFPGRDNSVPNTLSPLIDYSGSHKNLTEDKILAFMSSLQLKLPHTATRKELLIAADKAINVAEIAKDNAFTDNLAKHFYWPDIKEHIAFLPEALKIKMRESRLI